MTARESLIAKLREAQEFIVSMNKYTPLRIGAEYVLLSSDEIERIIADLEYCDFAHRALENGELPQTLKKQAG